MDAAAKWMLGAAVTIVSGLALAEPPNVVLVLADDQTWTDSGAYGNGDVPTPSIDRLAREGMTFTHAFTSTAMCAPTRQQLYTGLYPVRSGAYANHSVVRDGTKSLVHYFSALGYRVGLTGKTHFGPVSSFPFEIVGTVPAQGALRKVDLAAAREFVERDADQPFFLVVASNDPHGPWTEGDASRFDPAEVAVPPNLVDTAATREGIVRYYAEIVHLDEQIGTLLDILEAAGAAANTIVIYTSEQGSSFPFAKWTLYDAGLRTALIVRWPGRVEPGSRSDALVQYVDIVPTLLEAAGGVPPTELDGMGFLSVLTGRSNRHRDFVYGVHTNRGIIHGVDYPIRSVRGSRYKLIENLESAATYSNITTVPPGNTVLASWVKHAESGDAWARARVDAYLHRPPVELYDTLNDPFELENLADDPAMAATRKRLENALAAWMRQQNDGGIATEHEALDHMNPEIVERIRQRYGEDALPR